VGLVRLSKWEFWMLVKPAKEGITIDLMFVLFTSVPAAETN
jgi:hypothetical protein